ncbi:terpenoid synthase [Lenzites betulinus]|nr:terpenoid synthase [Lenzites betulinus]
MGIQAANSPVNTVNQANDHISEPAKGTLSLISGGKSDDTQYAVMQDAIRDLLERCAYRSPKSATDPELRRDLAAEVAKWDANLPPAFLAKSVAAGCIYVETAYGHTPRAHRHYIALYIVCMLYADDLGEQDSAAVVAFTRRFVGGERQPNAVFECLAGLLRRAYTLWPQFGADSIITGTLNALAANHIESSTRGMAVRPLATRYPTYLRLLAGIATPFTHFVFPNTWRETPESYVQILPEIDHWTLGVNDILSFYKEELAGETNNYIHLRADAEQTSVDDVLRRLVDEVADTALRVNKITEDDPELAAIWTRYTQCYIEFHLKTPRYRLTELGFSA